MKDTTAPEDDLYVVGRVRPVQMEIPLENGKCLSCRGQAQTSYAGGERMRLISWPEKPISSSRVDVGNRDCSLKFDLCGTPLRVSTRVLQVISRDKPVLLLQIRDYIYLDQKRQSFRAPVQVPVLSWMINSRGRAVPPKNVAKSINMSEGGILLWSKSRWPVGQTLLLEFDLGETAPPIRCTASVVRSEQDGAYGVTALQWEDISQAARDAIVKLCFAKQRQEISRLKAGGEVLSSEE
jgi:hypothetical protein